jgi:hypothetical protein
MADGNLLSDKPQCSVQPLPFWSGDKKDAELAPSRAVPLWKL